MPSQTKILVDTNSYFRLAQNIHPLLKTPFGKALYTLYAHKDLNWELNQVSRLKGKLQWVQEERYINNRNRSPSLTKAQKEEIKDTFDFMWEHAKEEFHAVHNKGPGDTDTIILATAHVLDIYVVTDDQDMKTLADTYEVKHMTSLELMKLMLDEQHIDLSKIDQVVDQWQHDRDLPHKNWKSEYENLFGNSPSDFV